jgi:hypothetical protein
MKCGHTDIEIAFFIAGAVGNTGTGGNIRLHIREGRLSVGRFLLKTITCKLFFEIYPAEIYVFLTRKCAKSDSQSLLIIVCFRKFDIVRQVSVMRKCFLLHHSWPGQTLTYHPMPRSIALLFNIGILF